MFYDYQHGANLPSFQILPTTLWRTGEKCVLFITWHTPNAGLVNFALGLPTGPIPSYCDQGCGVGVGVARSRGNDAGFTMGVGVGVGADRTRDNDKE